MLDRLDAQYDAHQINAEATAIGGRGCATRGHLYGGPHGWRACACDRTIPAHTDTAPDPAGGPGCAMVWRVCARCPHIDEHHLTDHDHDHPTAERSSAERGRWAPGSDDEPGRAA